MAAESMPGAYVLVAVLKVRISKSCSLPQPGQPHLNPAVYSTAICNAPHSRCVEFRRKPSRSPTPQRESIGVLHHQTITQLIPGKYS
jgi:hypothetical protein